MWEGVAVGIREDREKKIMLCSHCGKKDSAITVSIMGCQSSAMLRILFLSGRGLSLCLYTDNRSCHFRKCCDYLDFHFHFITCSKYTTLCIQIAARGSSLQVVLLETTNFQSPVSLEPRWICKIAKNMQNWRQRDMSRGGERWRLPWLWREEVERPGVSLSTPLWLLLLEPVIQSGKTTLKGARSAQCIYYS